MNKIRNLIKIKQSFFLAKISCFKIDRKFDITMKMSRCFKTNITLFHLEVWPQDCLLLYKASHRSLTVHGIWLKALEYWAQILSHSSCVIWINDLTSLSCGFSPINLR